MQSMVPHISGMALRPLARCQCPLTATFIILHVLNLFKVHCFLPTLYLRTIIIFLQVEIEVPQTCSFIVRTTGCSLSEVADIDTEGNPVFRPAPSSAAFASEMERYDTYIQHFALSDTSSSVMQ